MTTQITLRDIDNRDGDEPYESTGTVEQVCGYIDGPLRRDLIGGDAELAEVLAAVRSGDLEAANAILQTWAVHLRPTGEAGGSDG